MQPQGLQDQAAGELGAQGGNVPHQSWGGFRGLHGRLRLLRRSRVKAMEKVDPRPLEQIAESILWGEEGWFRRDPSAIIFLASSEEGAKGSSTQALHKLHFQAAPHGHPTPIAKAVLGDEAPAFPKAAFSLVNHIDK